MIIKLLVVSLAIGCTLARGPSSEDCTKWTGGPIDWPCDLTESLYRNGGKYISKNVIATRAVVWKDSAIVALPRFKKGVPITLGIIPLFCKVGYPSLSPYPCWSVQEEGNCGAFQSVVDLFLDPQHILWVLDTGIVDSLEPQPVRTCSPKVVAINVKTGKMVKTIDLSGMATSTSRLQYVVADYSADGRAFIYVTDAATRAILVYDVTSGQGYRVVLPKATTVGCAKRDVLYPSLIHRPDGSGVLLISYLSGSRLFSVRTELLQNGAAAGKIHDLGPKPKKMVMLGTDNGSAVFFRYEGEQPIYRWDVCTPFSEKNFLKVYEGDGYAFASEVIPDYKRGRMRVLESNFPDFIRGTVGVGVDHSLTIM
ncbi:major royal jelly protein 2 [Diachasma alloeum]|uniref:major royal jelly protein 2 n=1 Tax=Diachasma alloeum TaxID=454923 RepID=UPI0007382CC8|nr:major royal jelly protein 2 [Diachasma alloeum]